MKTATEKKSYNMSKIKSKDSQIELKLRKFLWNKGYRYFKNCKDVYGKPDIVFKKIKLAIFCDSEFWHGYNWNKKSKDEFKTNKEFWIQKIEKNLKRDAEVNKKLKQEGWTILRFWGKQIIRELPTCFEKIEKIIKIKRGDK